jgi:hypothetical protein
MYFLSVEKSNQKGLGMELYKSKATPHPTVQWVWEQEREEHI